jgi:ribosome-associated translation inhibitor RaiA
MEHSSAMDARILELASRLESINPRITSCHVVVDEVDRHRTKGNLFEVHVNCHVPGHGEIVSSRHSNADPYLALTAAFEAVQGRLEGVRQIERREVKLHIKGNDESSPP